MMSDYLGKDIFKLGFGLMRLPHLENGENDMPQIIEMVDKFIAAGGTYFDTAYVYDGGRSEIAFREAVAKRYPRESYTVATKINSLVGCTDEASCKAQFETSLERTGAGYFDFYLLHALSKKNAPNYDSYHIWEYAKELKEQGKIRHWGFSFHDQPEFLDELLTKHSDAEFVQLQINYADMEAPNVRARECLEVCRKHGKPVVIMEPVKGGSLSDPIPAVKALFDKAAPDMSYASWAVRYCASLEGVITVLSGMSTLGQMEDNLSYMKDFKPLSEAEQQTVKDVLVEMEKVDSVPCTSCKYCVEGCPMNIPINSIFSARNKQLVFNQTAGGKKDYANATKDHGKAGDCIGWGQGESVCPQHLPIIELLAKVKEFLE